MSLNLRRVVPAVFLSLLFLNLGAQAQRGAQVKLVGLDDLTAHASDIVRGTVTTARVEPHPQFANLMTVLVTFRVEKTLKGKGGQEIQFRQYVWDVRDQRDEAIYRHGQRMVLMLGPVSQAGLRSPVGLGQGRFRITKAATGEEIAVNETGNTGLFAGTAARKSAMAMGLSNGASRMVNENRGGPMRLEDFEKVVQGFAKNAPARSAQ
jgi:hypothetical protein